MVQRLEQMGFDTLRQLAGADMREIVTTAAGLAGSACWKNSPQAHAAIDGAIGATKRFMREQGAAKL
ncbi:MAG: helix-hairpin-helix domain-containing protein [Xanthomonadaceae bacterium]|nr:helix-hairpin-helix domain-containing protein [Xanthomonadaceae bacterium]